MLSNDTQSVYVSEHSEIENTSFEYQWLSAVSCSGFLDRKAAFFPKETSSSQVVTNVHLLKEEELLSLTSLVGVSSDEKATLKYPRRSSRISLLFNFIINLVVYFFALVQLWRNVGIRMPAPYACLQTTFRLVLILYVYFFCSRCAS